MVFFDKKPEDHWTQLITNQLEKYFMAKLEMFNEPRSPARIVQVYSCLQDLEFLVQAKIQRISKESQENYKLFRIPENEIVSMEQSSDFTEAVNRFHRWALALEPYFRKLQPPERTSIDIGNPEGEKELE